MLERIQDLPADVLGVRAVGTVSKQDYEQVLEPLLHDARRQGRRIRFLYAFGPSFDGFTPGAAWDDARVGLRYLRLFERCAVVSDKDWVRAASRALATMMPCAMRVFSNGDWDEAIAWLEAPARSSSIDYKIIANKNLLLLEPRAKLQAEDFDSVATAVDTWLDLDGGLQGVVIRARKFPGWEDLGSFLRHVSFVGDYHKNISRVAVAADGKVAALAPKVLDPFIHAEVKTFGHDELDRAVQWASGSPG
ncbi:MAG: STAS/SEC14 domain-containing protein [Myxococcota bacterium]